MSNRQDGKTPPPISERAQPIPSKVWKKKYPCKKNKGDHTPVITNIYHSKWHQEEDGTWINPKTPRYHSMYGTRVYGLELYFVEWECTACKKRLHEFRPPQKKFDKYRS